MTQLCKDLDRCGGELIAIDGSTLQAVNGTQRTCSGRTLVRLLEENDAKLAAYFQHLDRQEAEDTPLRPPTAAQRQQQREPWQERAPRDQCDQQPRQQSGETQMSLTDPDRRTITRGDSRMVGDHVQVAADEQHKLIVAHDVTQAVTDQHQLGPMAERAQQP